MQKKKILRYARPILLVLLAIVCPISFLVRNTKYYGVCNFYPRKIDESTKKFLFHIFGIKNMNPEDKKKLLEESTDLKSCYKGSLDSIMNKVFPDQEIMYGVDSNFVISFHLANGNPKIHIGFLSCVDYKSYFQDDAHHLDNNGIFLTPYDYHGNFREINLKNYFSEISHSKQFYDEPFRYAYLKLTWEPEEADSLSQKFNDSLVQRYADSLEYKTLGTIEYEAHKVIQPVLEKFYKDYRRTYFGGIIKNAEERLREAENDLAEHGAQETLQYEAEAERKKREKNAWLYGTLYRP